MVHHSLEALRLTGHLLLLAHKLLARARDGTTKHKVAQRTQLAASIGARIELAIKWFSHAHSTWTPLQLTADATQLGDVVELWLDNEYLQATIDKPLSTATKEAMDALLGVADCNGAHWLSLLAMTCE